MRLLQNNQKIQLPKWKPEYQFRSVDTRVVRLDQLGRLKIDGLPRQWSLCACSRKLLFLTLNDPDSAARAIENRWFAPPVESLRLFSQALILGTQPSWFCCPGA
ncbi:MAG: hypothetical protein NTW32_20195 [Chloroflexi bacterium]|nr:hypothetical protein [Chloroflexota bacterium]